MITDIKDDVITVEGEDTRFGDMTIDELGHYVIDLTELRRIKNRLERANRYN